MSIHAEVERILHDVEMMTERTNLVEFPRELRTHLRECIRQKMIYEGEENER